MRKLKIETYKGWVIYFRKFPEGLVVAKIRGKNEIFSGDSKISAFDKAKLRIDEIERLWDMRRDYKRMYTLEEARRILL